MFYFELKICVVLPIQDFCFYLIWLFIVHCLLAYDFCFTAPQLIVSSFLQGNQDFHILLLRPGLIGEIIRGRPPLTILAWDEKFIAPYLSCFSPETSMASSPLRPLGAILFKQLMRWPWVPTPCLKHSYNNFLIYFMFPTSGWAICLNAQL